jgi:hypothetical protein
MGRIFRYCLSFEYQPFSKFLGIHIKNQTFDERCGYIYNYERETWEIS